MIIFFKSLVFASRSEACAHKAHAQLNGEKLECEGNTVTLYLSYVKSGTHLFGVF